jgi:hypothetical protein
MTIATLALVFHLMHLPISLASVQAGAHQSPTTVIQGGSSIDPGGYAAI